MLFYRCIAINTRTNEPVSDPMIVSISNPPSNCTKFLNQQIVNSKFQTLIEEQRSLDKQFNFKYVGIDWFVRSVQITQREAEEQTLEIV